LLVWVVATEKFA